MTYGIVRPSACLEPEALGALAEGGLAGAERDAAVRHLATCRRCHEIFASSVQILEGEGVLPVVSEEAPARAARRGMLTVWVSAAAAALVAAALLLPRSPDVREPQVAQASPTPVAIVTPAATAAPTPAPALAASLPPEAIEALRTLGGFESPYRAPASFGFADDPHKAAVRKGIADVDAAARTLGSRGALATRADESQVADGAVDLWRRVGRILEASRLALAAPSGTADAFFTSPWARSELSQASALLREAGVLDPAWADDVRRAPLNDAAAEKLRDRLDELLEDLS